jgi:hypothetical protein
MLLSVKQEEKETRTERSMIRNVPRFKSPEDSAAAQPAASVCREAAYLNKIVAADVLPV